jgi:uncharacterized protein
MWTTKVFHTITDITASAWNSLVDTRRNPFMSYAWLAALETTGCASAETGWLPRHITLWRDQTLVAAIPAYVKDSSEGDFSRDWQWADAFIRGGVRYYPKLVVGVPFTPVTGKRMLINAGESEPTDIVRALLEAATAVAKDEGCTVVQVLYCDEDEAHEAECNGFVRRVDFQYHWRNEHYRDPEDFYARFDSKRRNQLKRERRAPAHQGIVLRTVRGAEIANEPQPWAHLVHALHRSTVDKLEWGRRWFNRSFYEHVFTELAELVEVVVAERNGMVIAGAFNVATPTRLYGRYWGCLEEHRYLHFNVCYYHSIDECIRRGTEVFEGGAGGEHKLSRGFDPAPTHSAHMFLDSRIEASLRAHIAEETRSRLRALAEWRARSPILKPRRETR